jgi:hypothetical protein
MKAPFVVFFLVLSAAAQTNPTPNGAPGCGNPEVKFNVKADKSQHPEAQPPSGKALVYFVENDDMFESFPKPTTRLGVDGVWVGANHGNSYLSFAVDPGEHHLCASWQSFVAIGSRETSGAAHFTAEAGQVYFFRVKNVFIRDRGHLEFSPIDSDEGQLLASRYALSTSHPKN